MAQSKNIRRVTGSANIPLVPEGEKQAAAMAAKYSHPFDRVFCAPEKRSIETAQHFGKPVVLQGLKAWYRGEHEGEPAARVKAELRSLILHPKMKPPGKSPISGKPGVPYGEWLKHLMHVMRSVDKHVHAGRTLIVMSGGNLQAVDHFAPLKFPANPDAKDFAELAKKPYWSATGQLFALTPNGLEKVSDDNQEGVYLAEHSKTAFNDQQNSHRANINEPENETSTPKYSSTQVNLPDDLSSKITDWAKRLPAKSLADDGLETTHHVTVKYGLHGTESQPVAETLKGEGPIKATVGALSVFKGANLGDPDVLKLNVASPDLNRLNGKITKLPHTDTHPTYQPHITIAYVKPGSANKHIGKMIPGVSGKTVNFDNIVFSPKEGENTNIPLRRKVR